MRLPFLYNDEENTAKDKNRNEMSTWLKQCLNIWGRFPCYFSLLGIASKQGSCYNHKGRLNDNLNTLKTFKKVLTEKC